MNLYLEIARGVVGGGAPPEESEPSATEIAGATCVLKRLGVRQMEIDGVTIIGVWSDLDGPELRTALRIHEKEGLPLRYLDGKNIPARYQLRNVAGEPVPLRVLAAMEQCPAAPWAVRDQMLGEARIRRSATSWAEWKAQELNRLFQEKGVTGQPGKITPETIR